MFKCAGGAGAHGRPLEIVVYLCHVCCLSKVFEGSFVNRPHSVRKHSRGDL